MKKWMTILCLSTLVLLVGCGNEQTQQLNEAPSKAPGQTVEPEITPEATPEVTPEVTPEASPEVDQSAEQGEEWVTIPATTDTSILDGLNLVNSYEIDFNQDGKNEVVELYSSALLAEEGEVAYDDGQTWSLIIREGEAFFNLVPPTYIQMGGLHYTLFENYTDEAVHILVTNKSSANILFEDFSYNEEIQSFVKEIVYSADNINVLNEW